MDKENKIINVINMIQAAIIIIIIAKIAALYVYNFIENIM